MPRNQTPLSQFVTFESSSLNAFRDVTTYKENTESILSKSEFCRAVQEYEQNSTEKLFDIEQKKF